MISEGIRRQDQQGLGNPTGQRMVVRPRGPMPFADGGIVTSPIVGLVGEAGPEAIIPLDRLGSMGRGGGNSYTINVSALNADAKTGEMIVTAIKRFERTSGSVFVSA
jgi:phage-related minor tail protein